MIHHAGCVRMIVFLFVLATAGIEARGQDEIRNPCSGNRAPEAASPANASDAHEPGRALDALAVGTTSGVEPGGPDAPHLALVPAPSLHSSDVGPAQTPAGVRTEPPASTVTREQIEQLQAELDQATGIDEALKAELVKRYAQTLDWLKTTAESAARNAALEGEISLAPKTTEEVKRQLETPTADPVVADDEATVGQLEQRLQQAEAQLKSAKEDLVRRDEELKTRSDKTAELARLIAETQQRIKDLEAAPPAVVAGEDQRLFDARRYEHEARLQARRTQLQKYLLESKRFEALVDLFPLQRDLSKRAVTQNEKLVAACQAVVTNRRKLESERAARDARKQVEDAHPALLDLAERNARLAEIRTSLAEAIERTNLDHKQIEKEVADLKSGFSNLEEKVRRAGHSTTIGMLLRKTRADLPSRSACALRQIAIGREVPKAHLALLELTEEREPLGDLEEIAAVVMADLDSSIRRAAAEQMVKELLSTKRELLDKLINDHGTYLQDLSELEVQNQALILEIERFAGFIDEHVLWIRSCEALQVSHFRQMFSATAVLLAPGNWLATLRHSGADVLRSPYYLVAVVLLAAILFLYQRRLRARLRALCDVPSRGLLRFWPTVEGVVLSLVIPAPWPMAILYVGWRLSAAEATTEFSRAVAAGLTAVAILLWASSFIRQLCRGGGVGESHFQWNAGSLRVFRRHLGWLTLAGLPLVFLVRFSEQFQDARWSDALGRIAFICGMFLLAAFFHTTCYPNGRLFRELRGHHPHSWVGRFRHVIYVSATWTALGLAVLAAIGYFYSAQQLAARLDATVSVMLSLILLHAVASRWFLVKRRNMSIHQARQRLAANQESNSSAAPAVSCADRDLSAIHSQLQYLLRYAVTVSVLIAVWMIWSDVLPALRIFDRVELWSRTVQVVEQSVDETGKTETHTTDEKVPTTLRHAIFAVLLMTATYLVGRNFPALLEITVLERLPIDHGGRHAIAILVKYSIALTGLILACRTMSITWSSIHWLVAAMTVGLGFGLQEIFANLVSGVIILVERPIRVGDMVTVGSVTGIVSDMRMRATTVTDFDRRELIVPNKKFITDDVINWTLSDSISRVVLPVGIAYGSDTALAHATLVKVARDHPIVLDEPSPSALFTGFGESTLDFELRVFIPNREVYVVVVHELNTAIDLAFRESGIEIAFPQRDINIRAVSQIVPMFRSESGDKKSEAA